MLIELSEYGQSLADFEIKYYVEEKFRAKKDIVVSNIIAFEYACYIAFKRHDISKIQFKVYGDTPTLSHTGEIVDIDSLRPAASTRKDIQRLFSGVTVNRYLF
jgi:hypothetical protein